MTMLKFKRVLRVGMQGPDVRAVKIGLTRAGFGHGIKGGNKFGGAVRLELEAFQKKVHLKADGVYGPATHAQLSTHFNLYARWLYNRTRVEVYVNPFAHCSSLVVGRIDMGVDYHGVGPIAAIGDAVIEGLGGGGWPGGEYILYRLTDGPMQGRYVYVAEAVVPKVKVGQRVRAGDVICYFGAGAREGFYPGIETGWSSPTVNLTRAAEMGNTGGFAHSDSPAGLAFARFLRKVGAPAPFAWFGPEYV